MPIINPLRKDLESFIDKNNLNEKWAKAKKLFETNIKHPSLNTERLEPKSNKTYSFRIDQKYRAIFIFLDNNYVDILNITNHYKK